MKLTAPAVLRQAEIEGSHAQLGAPMTRSPMPLGERVTALLAQLCQSAPPDTGVVATPPPIPATGWCEPFHEAWLAHEQDDARVRLAYARAAELAAARPVIAPGELIIGGDALAPLVSGRATPFGNHIRLYPDRAPAIKQAHPELAPQVDDLVAYWQQWLAAHPAGPGLTCHASLAYGRVLALGLDGLKDYVVQWRDRQVAAAPEKAPWYQALLITVDGLAGFIRAHAEAARELAARAETQPLRDDLTAAAARCSHVAHWRPRSFAEAAQLFYLLFLACGHDSPGPVDRMLWPALQEELQAGTISLEQAQELLDCLWIKFAAKTAYGATLGGQLPDGADACNPVSYLCLEAHRRLRLLSPRTAVRWHRGLDPDFLHHACAVVAEGPSFPAFVNDEAIVAAATARGITLEHAREYTFVGCGQVYPHGRGNGNYEDLMLNAAKLLELALHDGCDPVSGRQSGPPTGDPASFASFDDLLAACHTQVAAALRREIAGVNARRQAAVGKTWDFLRSLLSYSCVERGLDWHEGGTDYSECMVDMEGLTTLLDSLLAIRVLVYEERRVSLPELIAVLDDDWAGHEDLRQYCLRQLPKFGNDDPLADEFVRTEAAWVNDTINGFRSAFDGPCGMDIIGWSGSVVYGELTGATPDGRRRGEALADCAGPAQGRNTHGLTATLNSVLCLPHGRAHGPLALSLRFPASAVRGEEGTRALRAVVATYFERGGQQLQISIASTADMLAALEHPEAYRSLMVRVGGFSAYFTQLDARWQQDMIARSEMEC